MSTQKLPQAAPRCVIYARVSTEDQATPDRISLPDQFSKCRQKIEEIGGMMVSYYEDAGVSGAFYEMREGIQAALTDIEEGRADTLVVARSDRLGRDLEHKLNIKRRLRLVGAELVFCDVNFANNAGGRAAANMKDVFDEMYRDSFRENAMNGRRAVAERGLQPARTYSPLGFHIVNKDDHIRGNYLDKPPGTYIIIEEKAELVREMFRRYLQGETLGGLCRWLYLNNISSPRNALQWEPSTVQRLLQNTAYKGEAIFGRLQHSHDETRLKRGYRRSNVVRNRDKEQWIIIPCPAIIEPEVFDALQCEMATRREKRSGNPRRLRLLSGLLRCPGCGHSMRSATQGYQRTGKPDINGKRLPIQRTESHNYACTRAMPTASASRKTCVTKIYNGKNLDARVLGFVQKIAAKPDLLEEALRQQQKIEPVRDAESERRRLIAELEENERREDAAVKAQIRAINPAPYERALAELAQEQQRLTNALQVLDEKRKDARAVSEAVPRLVAALEECRTILFDENADMSQRREVLSTILEHVVPHADGALDFRLKTML